MASLTQLTLDADGTIPAAIRHDAGTGSPFYTHGNDAPDGLSSDYLENDDSETSGAAWFSLSGVDADFASMDTLNIDVDVQAVGFGNDTCTLSARIADGDASATWLSDESGTLGTDADGTRVQRNLSFTGLSGTKAQWDTAHIRFTWTYTKVTGPDNANLRLYGCDLDGTYTVGAGEQTRAASLNAAVRAALSRTTSLAGVLQAQRTSTASLDSALRARHSAMVDLDVAVALARQATAALDAAVRAAFALSSGLDASLAGRVALSASLDAAARRALSLAASLDARLTAPGGAGLAASLDAALSVARAASAVLDAALAGAASTAAGLDAAVRGEGDISALLDAAVVARFATHPDRRTGGGTARTLTSTSGERSLGGGGSRRISSAGGARIASPGSNRRH